MIVTDYENFLFEERVCTTRHNGIEMFDEITSWMIARICMKIDEMQRMLRKKNLMGATYLGKLEIQLVSYTSNTQKAASKNLLVAVQSVGGATRLAR